MTTAALSVLFAIVLPIQAKQPQPPQTLTAMRDRYRPLLIFSSDDNLFVQVRALQEHAPELIERQVMLVPSYGALATMLDPRIETLLTGEDQEALRRRFHVDPKEFTVVLLGKDGGEKFRAHNPITIEKLIELIDAMPMRREEMKSRPPH